MKKNKFIIFFAIIGIFFFILNYTNSKKPGSLPDDLMYEGKPIDNKYMRALVPCISPTSFQVNLEKLAIQWTNNYGDVEDFYDHVDDSTDVEENIEDDIPDEDRYRNYRYGDDYYYWDYIGTLSDGDHLVFGQNGKFTGISRIRKENNILKVISEIESSNRYSTSFVSRTLEGNVLTYVQSMTPDTLNTILTQTFFEYEHEVKRKKLRVECEGETYIGTATLQVTFKTDARKQPYLVKSTLLYYTTHEDKSNRYYNPNATRCICPQEEKAYYEQWLENTALNSLSLDDALRDVIDYYAYKTQTYRLNIDQLREAALEVCKYAK